MFIVINSCHPGFIYLKLEQQNQCNIEIYAVIKYFPNTKFIQGLKEKMGWRKREGAGDGKEGRRVKR